MTWLQILLVSFVVTLLLMPPLIRFLGKKSFGITVRAEVVEHLHKMGTPKAGGLVFLLVPTVACLLFGPTQEVWALLLLLVCSGAIGFADDFISYRRKNSLGLMARYKILLQLVPAFLFAWLTKMDSAIWIPFIPPLDIGWWYIPVAMFVIICGENSVNLTDGADGLAGTIFLTVIGALIVVAFLQGTISLFPFMFSLAGVVAGYLWFNIHPASVIMGDTGSLALGAAMAGLSLILHIPLFLPFIAVIFVVETVSVILQIFYFRRTGGKRLFKRSPLHHHFQLSNWSEAQIVFRFSLVNLLFIALAFLFIWV